ncbi:hypothetical protein GGR54DRAFT_516185 [Hypoxylon sp. NC1633]|nr:hypothetical protein GGR54DRAFT_516185 [Hypoxylon sp. NC1633]
MVSDLIGHMAAQCKAARKIDRSNVRLTTSEHAWAKIMQGAEDKDIDMVKEGVQEYVKAEDTVTYIHLEQAFRAQEIKLYLIAVENPMLLPTHTHMDLQGNLDKTYRVHYRWSDKPLRPREAQYWPKSPEDNMERLADAGETIDRGLPKCTNCGELGHISKRCAQEKVEKERPTISCYNCGMPGHRVRDCEYSTQISSSSRN